MKSALFKRVMAICLAVVMALPTAVLPVFADDGSTAPVTDPSIDGAEVYALQNEGADPKDIVGVTTAGDEKDPDPDSIDEERESTTSLSGAMTDADAGNDAQDPESPDENDGKAVFINSEQVSKAQLRQNMQLFESSLQEATVATSEEEVYGEMLSEDGAAEDDLTEEEVSEGEPASGTCGENTSWVLQDNILYISGSGAIDNYSESPWLSNNTEIVGLVIDEGITSIGQNAFSGLSALETAQLPDSIEKIGFKAFCNCTSLREINIPDSWNECPSSSSSGTINTDYCGSIFKGCQALTSIEIPEGRVTLPMFAFSGCNYLTEVKLPSTLTDLPMLAFANCSKLQSIDIPEGTTAIKKSTFLGCSGLQEVNIPDSVTELAMYAFSGCSSLESVKLPDTIEKIGYQAFNNCSKLAEINIPNSWNECPSSSSSGTINTDYCGSIFKGCQALTSIDIPEGRTTLPVFAFSGCNYLTEVKLPSTLTDLPMLAFANCSKLQSIDIPEGTTAIRKSTFLGCSGLQEVNIPDSVTELAMYAFSGCSSLVSVKLPDTIEKIGYRAFYNCSKLAEINIPSSWNECPSSSSNGTVNASYCGHIFEGCSSMESISIPEGRTSLPSYAFCGSNYLTSVNLPDSLEELNKAVFYECSSLVYTELPDSLATIGEYAFGKCTALRAAVFPASLKVIGAHAYDGCSSLAAVSIPKTVNLIGDKAFNACNAISGVYYEGTEEEWNELISGAYETRGTLRGLLKASAETNSAVCPFPEDVINFNILCDYAEPDKITEQSYTQPADSAYNDFYGGYCSQNGHDYVDVNEATFGIHSKKMFVSLPKDSFITYGFSKAILCPDNTLIEITTTGNVNERADIYVMTLGGDLSFVDTIYETSNQHAIKLKDIADPVVGIKVVGRDLDGSSPGFDIVDIALVAQRTNKEVFKSMHTSVSMKRWNKSFNLIASKQEFEEDSDEEATILVSPDWGMDTPGTIALVQNSEVKAQNKGGSFVDIQPGKMFSPSGSIYVVLLDSNNEIVDQLKIWLTITKKVVPHKVKYNANGGKASFGEKILNVGDIYGDFPEVTRKGYFCTGWYTAKTGGSRVYEHQEMDRNEDHTLFAHWVKADLAKADITMAKTVKYNGAAQRPKVTVTLKGITLTKGVDYTVTYSNNKNVSTKTKKGKAVIKGCGEFAKSKSITKTFTITKGQQVINITDTDLRLTKDKKGAVVPLGVSLKFGNTMTVSKAKTNSVVSIPKKSVAKVKLLKYGTAKITINAPGTTNYKGASKVMYVSLQKSQSIKLTTTKLTYDKDNDWYVLGKTDLQPFDLGIKTSSAYTTFINCRDGAEAAITGSRLQVVRPGTVEVTVNAKDTRTYTGLEKTFIIKVEGFADLYAKAGDWITRQESDGKLVIEGYDGPGGNVTVPDMLEPAGFSGKKTVKAIGDSVFKDRTDIKTVKIEGTQFTSIGSNAFKGCTGMTKIELPESLTTIESNAFYGCSALKEAWLPQKLKKIGSKAFYGCKALPEVDMPSTVTSVGTEAFAKCTGIKAALLPGKIKTVSGGMFNGCTALKEITIPASATSFGDSAFYKCTALKNVWYGSGKSQWKAVGKGVNNGVISKAHVYTYADGPAPSSSMSDDKFFKSYQGSLNDKSFFRSADMLHYAMQNYMCGLSSDADLKVILKHNLTNVGVGNIKDIISWLVGYQDVTERKVYQELALEVLNEALNSTNYEDIYNDSDVKEIYDIFKSAYKKGDTAFGTMLKDDEERYRFAQRLTPYFDGVNVSEMNKALKIFQLSWDSLSTATGYLDKGVSAIEYMCTFFTIYKINPKVIDRLILVVPKNSHLYTGLTDTKEFVTAGGLEKQALMYLSEEVISRVSKEMVKAGLAEADKYFGGHKTLDADCYMFIASAIYKSIGYNMKAPSLNDYQRALMMMVNTMEMRLVVQEKISSGRVYPIEMQDAMTLYLACLKRWEPYVTKTITGFETGPYSKTYLSQMVERYKSVLTYENYLNTCKYHAVNGN